MIPTLTPLPASARPPAAVHAPAALMILWLSLMLGWYSALYSTARTSLLALSLPIAAPFSLTATALSVV